MKRFELKYVVDGCKLESFLAALERVCEEDAFGRYAVRSIYFDTCDFLYARKAIEHPDSCMKFRLRKYGATELSFGDVVYAEKKIRQGGCCFKERQALAFGGGVFPECLRDPAEGNAAGSPRVLDEMIGRELRPLLRIDYARRAFIRKDGVGDARITVDDHLRCGRESEFGFGGADFAATTFDEGSYLIEIKFEESMPGWVERLVAQTELERTDYSKYVSAHERLIAQRPALSA